MDPRKVAEILYLYCLYNYEEVKKDDLYYVIGYKQHRLNAGEFAPIVDKVWDSFMFIMDNNIPVFPIRQGLDCLFDVGGTYNN